MNKYQILGSEDALVNGKPLLVGGLEQPENVDRLASTILRNEIGFDGAMRHSRAFQAEILSRCPAGDEISSDEIEEWYHCMRDPSKGVPSLLRTRRFHKPPVTA